MTEELKKLRDALDKIDRSLIENLGKRDEVISKVAELKAIDPENPFRDIPREEQLLTKLVEIGKEEGLDAIFITRVFREILEQSVRIQQEKLSIAPPANEDAQNQPHIVAYQGAEGSYSHQAATRHFSTKGNPTTFKGYDNFRQTLEAVQNGAAHFAVLPIENTTAGSINESYDLLATMDLSVVGEEVQTVDHCLIALEDIPITKIRRVYSHPQALVQCSQFLSSLHDCHQEAYKDTAMSVSKIIEDQDLSQAAIASEQAAIIHGLPVLKRNIANQKQNFTRMVIVAKEPSRFDLRIACKTSLIIATRHDHGALSECLNILSNYNLNLTKLESRPKPNTPWQYHFYLDFEGNLEDEQVQAALKELRIHTSFMKVLGSYPSRNTESTRAAEPMGLQQLNAQQLNQQKNARQTSGSAKGKPKSFVPMEASIREQLEKKPYKLVARTHREKDTEIQVGNVVVGGDNFIVMAGPCSVESREQVTSCAKHVKAMGGHILRGGCFKPRTSPYSFQGLGYKGLDLMEQAGIEAGLPIITEVMETSQVAPVAKQAHALQIGARNMQNFALLKEVGKVDKPVMLKRGLNATIDEWLQAAEYILAHGNQQVILCERGIRTFETATRNTLDLSAVPVVRERTHLPIVVDPSHGVGVSRWIPTMAKAAAAAGAQGIMIEIHPNPAEALSDGPQALTFDDFEALMRELPQKVIS